MRNLCAPLCLALLIFTLVPVDSFTAVVVGKVIIDEYLAPGDDPSTALVSVGGGGPQAAYGAAAALCVLGHGSGKFEPIPPQQNVAFFGPVGQDWTEKENKALNSILGPAVDSIHLTKAKNLITPRIQLWHDASEIVQWKPLYDSLGEDGADQLWRDRPSSKDILEYFDGKYEVNSINSLHTIMEMGSKSPGGGDDALLLNDPMLLERIKFIGAEPVAFPENHTGKVSNEDAISCARRFERFSSSINFACPDIHLYESLSTDFWRKWETSVRNGQHGSFLVNPRNDTPATIPAATLNTPNGQPINPTGAGNAFSSAMTALLGAGVSVEEASCIATAIGAVVCEYDHLPPWTGEVMSRIRKGAVEVREKVDHMKSFV